MAEDNKTRKLREKLDKLLEANKNEAAAELLQQLMELEPKNVRWCHKRGDLLRKLGKDTEALGCYEIAVGIYADQGFIARAVAMAKTVLNIDPKRIDILESVDPNAAQQLYRQQKAQAEARSGKPAPAAAPATKRHAMVLDDDLPPPPARPAAAAAPAAAAKRHPMVLDDDPPLPPARPAAPAAPAAAPKRHPMVLDDDLPPPAAAPARAAVAASPTARRSSPEPPRAPAQPLPPPPPMPRVRKQRDRPVTLDNLVLPPPVDMKAPPAAQAPTPKAPDAAAIYGQALGSVEELRADPSAPPNETRFSNAPPPRRGISVEFTAEELEPREAVPQLESQRPEPPSARKLSSLPLFPLFAEAPRDALAEMIAQTDLIELGHGEYVMRKGDPGDALYGIVEGSVGVIVPGQSVRLTLAEGDVFGESCLLQDEKRHADVIVEGKLVALRIPRDVLTQLLGSYPKLAEVLLELLTRRLLGNLLQSSPLFQEFDGNGRRELARMFEIRRAPAGTMLAVVGKRMDGLYISLTGTLGVNHPGAPERIAPPGAMFGQSTLLSNELSQVDIRARVNMVVLRLPHHAFTQVAMQYPTILARLAELAHSEVVKITT